MQAFLESSPRFRSPFYKAAHVYCGNNADLVAAVAPYITKTRGERWRARLTAFAKGSKAAVQKTPHVTVNLFQTAVKEAPVVAARVKEDLTMFRELRAEKKRAAARAVQTMDAAAEE